MANTSEGQPYNDTPPYKVSEYSKYIINVLRHSMTLGTICNEVMTFIANVGKPGCRQVTLEGLAE